MMVRLEIVLTLLIGCTWLCASAARSEPWLGSRYARNCAGCHAPQRINLKPIDRRCSLSCQGCHVNPNGGGLRSFYGKWTGNRWLKSWRSDILKHDLNVAIYPKQIYAKKRKKWRKAPNKLVFGKGFPLVETRREMNEDLYYWQYGRYQTTAKNKKHYLYQVPAKDPWRQMRLSKWDGGADVRWFAANMTTEKDEEEPQEKWVSFPMNVDLGIRYRPLYRKIHVVWEGRMFGSPAETATYENMLRQTFLRSFYVMWDDIPYNIFVMGGYFRPLFGNYDPYHYGLAQKMFSYTLQGNAQAYNIVYEAITVGTAPNVPYLNVHKIGKRVGSRDDRTEGYALNLGFRGVRYGQSLNYSYWSTVDTATDTKIQMHSIGAFYLWGPVTLSYEGMSFARDIPNTDFRQGGVHTVEAYFKFWREFYWQTTAAAANVSQDLLPGSSSQFRTGIKAFLIPGFEVGVHLEQNSNTIVDEEADTESTVSSSGWAANIHAYF
ncbi:MAG: hypothetical protein HRU09_03745 [Oligoflexales bacterium]|nr:hypothetical protein [Oligoflexales bacterium]